MVGLPAARYRAGAQNKYIRLALALREVLPGAFRLGCLSAPLYFGMLLTLTECNWCKRDHISDTQKCAPLQFNTLRDVKS